MPCSNEKKLMKDKNFLEYIYKINDDLSWSRSDDGEVVVDMVNKGLVNRIAQLIFKKPAVSHIHLQDMGSFVFGCIDGKRNVFEIGKELKSHFGDRAEPLYERLCVYMKQLERAGFIKPETGERI